MKKFGTILLSLIMMMSIIAVPAFAEGEIVIDATEDVVSFYDNGLNGGKGSMETLNGNLMLRQVYEWTAYDISAVPAGTYSVSVSYVSTAQIVWKNVGLEWIVDGGAQLRSYLEKTGTAWSDAPVSADAGKIYIAEGSKELKVKNIGMYPINLDTITLTYVGAENTTEDIKIYGQNMTYQANEAGTGADSVLEEDYWDAATGTSSSYTRLGSDGLYHLPPTNGSILESTKLVQHGGDWTNFDISDFKAGTYEVTLNRAHKVNASYKLKIDGSDALSFAMTKTADEYGTYADAVVGKIYVPEGAERLTLANVGSASVYVDYMTFNYISAERDPETYPEFSISAANVIPGGQGVGYYANSMNNTHPDTLETSGANVVLRQAGEWAAYDVSGLEPGIYTLNLSYTVRETTFYLDVYVDDELQAVANPPKTTNSLGGTPDTVAICDVEITRDSEVLMLRNSSNSVTFVQTVALEYQGTTRENPYIIRQYGDHATRTDASNVIVIESGVDYYDAGGKAFASCLENGILAQNSGDWARYDISGIKKGTYQVTINYSSIAEAQYKLKVDGKIIMTPTLDATGTSYGTYTDAVLDNVYIEEGAEYLILENEGAGSVYPKYIEFEFVSEGQEAWTRASIKANDVISGGDGAGYYDAGGAGKLETAEGSVVLRQNDWVKYDVTELKPGTYSLSLLNGSTSACRIKAAVDGETKLIVSTVSTETYTSYEENYLGNIYITEDTETVTIENAGATNTYLNKVIFDYVSDADESYMDINIPAQNVYQPDGFAEEGVSYYDAGGDGKLETSGLGVVLRNGDWYRYDLSELGLPAGVYSVHVQAQANALTSLDIEAEGTGEKRNGIIPASESAEEVEIGKLIVGEASNYFTVSIGDAPRVVLTNIKIATAYEETSIDYSTDERGTETVTSLNGLTSAYAVVDLTRPEKANIGETVYIGIYEGGRLVDVLMDEVTAPYNYKKAYELKDINENTLVKTFVWGAANDPVLGESTIDAK